MSELKPKQPYHEIRRKDRAKDDAWIQKFLDRASYGVLATVSEEQPFNSTNLFVYDPAVQAIYLHTAIEGRARSNIEANSQVCFSASEMGRLLPADTAMEFGVEYSGVVIFGQAYVVEDAGEAERALQALLDKYFPHLHPGEDYRGIIPEELAITTVIRIDIQSWSGKQEQAPADFPGAFLYSPGPDAE